MKHIIDKIIKLNGGKIPRIVRVHGAILNIMDGTPHHMNLNEGADLDLRSVRIDGHTYQHVQWDLAQFLPTRMTDFMERVAHSFYEYLLSKDKACSEVFERMTSRRMLQLGIPYPLRVQIRKEFKEIGIDADSAISVLNNTYSGGNACWLYDYSKVHEQDIGYANFISWLNTGRNENTRVDLNILLMCIAFAFPILYKESFRKGNKGIIIPALDAQTVTYNMMLVEILYKVSCLIEQAEDNL